MGFRHVGMIWHNWAKSGQNMGCTGGRLGVHDPLKSLVVGPCLLGNCYLERWSRGQVYSFVNLNLEIGNDRVTDKLGPVKKLFSGP